MFPRNVSVCPVDGETKFGKNDYGTEDKEPPDDESGPDVFGSDSYEVGVLS